MVRRSTTPPAALRPAKPPVALPQVLPGCTGCGRCVAACPPDVLSLEAVGFRKTAHLHDIAGCTGCGRCVPVCPFDAIRMVRIDRRGAGGDDPLPQRRGRSAGS